VKAGPGGRRRRALTGDPVPVFASDAFVLFHDIEVVPGEAFRLQSVLLDGGPVWPDFDRQALVRMVRRGRYVDEPVTPSDGPHEVIRHPCVWGGYAIPHFGHLIADHLTRVLEGRVNRPQDVMLFLLRPGQGVGDLPGYFWDLMDWYGVPRGQVRFVTVPLRVAELRCFAQAEPFQSSPPSPRYLDLLAQNAVRRGLVPEVAPVVYVGRMGMLAQAKGGAAGEGYLVEVLQRAGVRVLDPARAPLRAQLAAYAGAGVLIFAEGSAVHGRQLLGWLDQAIVVLNRRQGARMAEAALTARSRGVEYVEATGQGIGMGTLAAGRQAAIGLALYDLTAVKGALARHGVDLTGLWDDVAYQDAVRADARAWLLAQRDLMGAAPLDLALATEALGRAGVPVDL
jgi:hypothetical protein